MRVYVYIPDVGRTENKSPTKILSKKLSSKSSRASTKINIICTYKLQIQNFKKKLASKQ
jgi:hypothetical protein